MPPEELLQMLVCPKSRSGPLKYDAATDRLICEECRIAFPVVDGIPNMLLEEAIPLD